MKKVLLFVCAVSFTLFGSAQMQSNIEIRDGIKAKPESYKNVNGNKEDIIEWFNYATEEADPISSGDNFFSTLFPDTLAKFNYSGNYAPVNFHSMGQVFDPKGFVTSHNPLLDSNDSYTVDSIAIPYRYFRFQTGAPDTLVIHLYNDGNLTTGNLGSGLVIKTAPYDYMTYRGTQFNQEIVKILDDADTSSGAAFIEEAVNIAAGPGESVGAVWTYLPGNSYSEGDTVFGGTDPVGNPLNRFDQFYHSDPDQIYYNGFFNSGMVVTQDVRYNESTNGWNGLHISGLVFTNYINVNVNFHVTALNVGLEDAEELGFNVKQNYPNPFDNTTMIEYSLETPSMVNIEVFDITGKSIMNLNEGFKNVGNYRVELNGSDLKNGVYYYSFRTERGQVTKKMMIQR